MAQSAGKTFDVVVIGGGVIGCSSAYHLARAGLSVAIVEADEVASVASGASAGGVRQQGRDPRELPIAMKAIARWPSLTEELGTNLDYRQGGHLTFVEQESDLPAMEARVRDQRQRGLGISMVYGDELKELVPGVSPNMLAGAWCPTDGHAMPILVTKAFCAAAQRHGAQLFERNPVSRLRLEGNRVTGVETVNGTIRAGQVLVAAGAWSAELMRPLGIEVPIVTHALQMMVTNPMPHLLDPVVGCVGRGLSLKQLPDGAYLMGGGWPGTVDQPHRFGRNRISSMAGSALHGSAVYLPLLKAQVVRAWTGLEAIAKDEVPILGPIPGYDGLTIACGFSGHGFALSPEIGRLMGEEISNGQVPEVVKPLMIDRFAA